MKNSRQKIKIEEDKVWGIIPARGGSKSIPLKNLAKLGGKPLLEYQITAAKKSGVISRIICSTDHEEIASWCTKLDVEVHRRPEELARDDTPVLHVLDHMLRDIGEREGSVAGILPILQPTSPFLLPKHIHSAVELLMNDPWANSSQTITLFPHNFHAFNQRKVEKGLLKFCFPDERLKCYNKQTKPKHYIFGNLVVVRARTILEKGEIFGNRSLPIEIPFVYSIDVDTSFDLDVAEWYLSSGKVILDL